MIRRALHNAIGTPTLGSAWIALAVRGADREHVGSQCSRSGRGSVPASPRNGHTEDGASGGAFAGSDSGTFGAPLRHSVGQSPSTSPRRARPRVRVIGDTDVVSGDPVDSRRRSLGVSRAFAPSPRSRLAVPAGRTPSGTLNGVRALGLHHDLRRREAAVDHRRLMPRADNGKRGPAPSATRRAVSISR